MRCGRADPLQIQLKQAIYILPRDLLALLVRKLECLDESDHLVRASDRMGAVRPDEEVIRSHELEGAAHRQHMKGDQV